MVSPARLLVVALLISVLLAAAGLTVESVRFGLTNQATASRVEREVRATVAERAGEVEALGRRVAAEGPLVAAAARDRNRLPELLDRLTALAASTDQHDTAATIYVPGATAGDWSPLAWGRGPGEESPSAERLAGPPALFVAPGHAGMRLISTAPVAVNGQPTAVVVSETVLAPNGLAPQSTDRQLMTSLGPVSVIEQYASTRDEVTLPGGFTVNGPDGVPLLEVHVELSELAARRWRFRRHALALALLPVAAAVGLLIPRVRQLRRPAGRGRSWLPRTLGASALIALTSGMFAALAWMADAPAGVGWALGAAAIAGITVTMAGAWWWQPRRRTAAIDSPLRFGIEQLLAGCIIAGAIEVAARGFAVWIAPATLVRWQFVLFPFDAGAALSLGTLLLLELALAWGVALVVATLAGRWRLQPRPVVTPAAMMLWSAPAMVLLASTSSVARTVAPGAWMVLACVVAFAPAASWLRSYSRHTTQSMRLVLGLLALSAPVIAFYPMSAMTADRATRTVIEQEYAPATADHPQQLRAELQQAQTNIDALATLPILVSGRPSPETNGTDTRTAYLVWSQTNLARTRVISDVELYGPDGGLVSRFAFNLPQYVYRATQQWRATHCGWDVFGEVAPFGAEARLMLHAMRGVCDASGVLRGGVVVHVASNDYQALPFVASANPYNALVGEDEVAATQRIPDLHVAVYGWSFQQTFSSGPVAWAVPRGFFERLYNPATPFWTTLQADGRPYHVHFSQNRAGIYALGYPQPTWFEHATRLAEMIALVAGLFVLIQLAAAASAPFTRRRQAPLGQLLHEIRTSFYRKLFLFFVAVAVVPVLIFAVVFGSYMTARFRADVEAEARTTVSVARRVFEELAAADARVDAPSTAPTDDVMVWIRQVIGQDVNLFEGSELVATSQRDLFDSGLLPTRTPADVYRSITLQRLPVAVVDDRVGDFTYLVAAAPVPARGRDAILTVPLAPRQREIEREADELNRGVLVGSVLVVLLAAALGASLASRVADPVARLTRATRQIAAGNLDVRIDAVTADELRRLVDDFNSMAETLGAQRTALARTNQLKAWNEMARQVAHEIKNPLTPIQLAAEHLQHVHDDRGRPLGAILDQCLRTILGQVRLLRQIASEFSNFAGEPTPRPEAVDLTRLVSQIVDPYRLGIADRVSFDVGLQSDLPPVWADRTLLARALTNLIENAIQAMPAGGVLRLDAERRADRVVLRVEDTGAGMDADVLARAFEPFFSTKTGGSGLGLANARRNIELGGGAIAIASAPGVGTTLTVSLPLASPDAPASASSPSR